MAQHVLRKVAKLENKNPLKDGNKHEYNFHTCPQKDKQEASLDCPMSTHSHLHTWISSAARPKSYNKISCLGVSTSKIMHLPLLESLWLLILTLSKLRHCNIYWQSLQRCPPTDIDWVVSSIAMKPVDSSIPPGCVQVWVNVVQSSQSRLTSN